MKEPTGWLLAAGTPHVLVGEVKTGNVPAMAPTTKRYGIEPWFALENKKVRHEVARECYHCAANVVVDSMCGRCGAKHRAQRADRRSDVTDCRQWNFLQLLAELFAHIFQIAW